MLFGCATPAPVKEALVSVDQGYADNEKLLEQYRELVSQINERNEKWFYIIKNRALLLETVRWATTDPVAGQTVDKAAASVDLALDTLGEPLVARINKVRLSGLPSRPGASKPIFTSGNGHMDLLIAEMPAIINDIRKRTKDAYLVKNDLSGFADIKTNLAVLRRINSTIRQYLDIDVTIKSEDINEIAKAIKALQ